MLLLICSALNLVLLIMAHLNTWRPITFQRLRRFQVLYCTVVANIMVGVATFRFVKYNGRTVTPSEFSELCRMVFRADDPVECVRTEYRMNWSSFLLYEVLLWAFLS